MRCYHDHYHYQHFPPPVVPKHTRSCLPRSPTTTALPFSFSGLEKVGADCSALHAGLPLFRKLPGHVVDPDQIAVLRPWDAAEYVDICERAVQGRRSRHGINREWSGLSGAELLVDNVHDCAAHWSRAIDEALIELSVGLVHVHLSIDRGEERTNGCSDHSTD